MAEQVADAAAAVDAEGPKKRKGGRKRDSVWDETTVYEDKTVQCNRCHGVIHRYGTSKVERVRAHFLNKCIYAKKPRVSGAPNNDPIVLEVADMAPVVAAAAAAGRVAAVARIAGTPKTTTVLALEPKARKADYVTKNGMFKRRFAHWVYASGLQFASVESELLVTALRSLRSDISPPTRVELENELLELEYNSSVSKVQRAMASKRCCLTIENWVTATGAPITSFSVVSEGAAYYLESVHAKQATGSVSVYGGIPTFEGEIPLEIIDSIMSKHKKSFFNCVVTPTVASLSKSTQDTIQKKHAQCHFFYGCVCQALRLLMSDMASVLPWLGRVTASVLEIVGVFHGNHKLQNQLRAPQSSPEQGKDSPLLLPISSSLCDSLESVLGLEQVLYSIVARRDFVESTVPPEEQLKLKRIQDFVLSESFVQDLVNSLAILRPLQGELKLFEGARVPLSLVLASFHNLLEVYGKMDWVNKKEKALISSCVNDRLDAIYSDVHGVAHMLDPLHLGASMDPSKKRDAEAFIVQYCQQHVQTLPQQNGEFDVLEQLSKYRDMVSELKSSNPSYWDLLVSGSVHPIDFWVERHQFPQLQQLAWAVFDLPVASTSSNIGFGQHGHFIHSRFHSTLSAEKLWQLTHIYCNSRGVTPGSLATVVGAPVGEGELLVHDF